MYCSKRCVGAAIEARDTPGPLHLMNTSTFDASYNINVRGVWLGIKYAVTQMLAQEPHPSGDRGWIINLSSVYGLLGAKYLSAYCTAKGAVTNMTRQAAMEYAENRIHVNSIHPGYCDSPFLESSRQKYGEGIEEGWVKLHPWGRLAWPEDVAKMAVFLAGDGASFITGQRKSSIVLEGGPFLTIFRVRSRWRTYGTVSLAVRADLLKLGRSPIELRLGLYAHPRIYPAPQMSRFVPPLVTPSNSGQ